MDMKLPMAVNGLFKWAVAHATQLTLISGIAGTAIFFVLSQYFITHDAFAKEKQLIADQFAQISQEVINVSDEVANVAEEVDLRILTRQINQLRLEIKFEQDQNKKLLLEATKEELEAEKRGIELKRIREQ